MRTLTRRSSLAGTRLMVMPATYRVPPADAGGPAMRTASAYFREVDANCGDASVEMTAASGARGSSRAQEGNAQSLIV
jgi:hypothetical protein